MKVRVGGKQIEILDVKELNYLQGVKGLMFTSKETAKPLLFNSRRGIHSFFVFYKFLILWLDVKNNVVDYRIVKPWKLHLSSEKPFTKFIEIPINSKYREIVDFVVERKI